MTYLKKPLSEEIKEKLRKIKELDSHLVSSVCTKIRRKSIERTAQINSFRIDYPQIKIPFSIPKNNGKKMIKAGIKNMGEAFMWGKRNFNAEEIDENFIKQIAGRITPELYENDIPRYREKGTMIKGATTTPPYPEKIRKIEMPWFFKKLKKEKEKAPLKRFSYWRTHPHISQRMAIVNQEITGTLEFRDYLNLIGVD